MHIDFDSLEIPPSFDPKDEDLPYLSFVEGNEQSIDDKADSVDEPELKSEEIDTLDQPQVINTSSDHLKTTMVNGLSLRIQTD